MGVTDPERRMLRDIRMEPFKRLTPGVYPIGDETFVVEEEEYVGHLFATNMDVPTTHPHRFIHCAISLPLRSVDEIKDLPGYISTRIQHALITLQQAHIGEDGSFE